MRKHCRISCNNHQRLHPCSCFHKATVQCATLGRGLVAEFHPNVDTRLVAAVRSRTRQAIKCASFFAPAREKCKFLRLVGHVWTRRALHGTGPTVPPTRQCKRIGQGLSLGQAVSSVSIFFFSGKTSAASRSIAMRALRPMQVASAGPSRC